MTTEELRRHQATYRPAGAVADSLRDKTLVMIVGPAAMGKSTIMNEMVNQAANFARVGDFTTREQRSNDEPGIYRYLSEAEAIDIIERRQAVQYAVHPTTGALYGTQLQDYPADFNLLDTLSDAVESLRNLPFKRTVTISLTASPHIWREWFLERYPQPSAERTKRLQEAKKSIDWSLGQTHDHHWLLNESNHQANVAAEAIAIARKDTLTSQGLSVTAGQFFDVIDELLLMDKML